MEGRKPAIINPFRPARVLNGLRWSLFTSSPSEKAFSQTPKYLGFLLNHDLDSSL